MTRIQTSVLSNLRKYRPTCSKLGLSLCASCSQDLAIYHLTSQFRAFQEKFRKFKSQRHYAMQIGTPHTDMAIYLAETRSTLWAEFHIMVLKLMNIELTNSAIHARLMVEAELRSNFMINAATSWYGPTFSIIPSRLIAFSISFLRTLLLILSG